MPTPILKVRGDYWGCQSRVAFHLRWLGFSLTIDEGGVLGGATWHAYRCADDCFLRRVEIEFQ